MVIAAIKEWDILMSPTNELFQFNILQYLKLNTALIGTITKVHKPFNIITPDCKFETHG